MSDLETAARQALESVAWINEVMSQAQVFASAWSLVGGRFDDGNAMTDAEQAKQELRSMLLATQHHREWRGLTDEEISDIFEAETRYHYPPICATDRKFARAIEAALKEKNHE
jgi:hypothetical protein